MLRRMLGCLALVGAVGVAPALASTISLGVTSPVNVGPFDVAVRVNDVFVGRGPGDVVVAFGFNVTIGSPSFFHFTNATAGSLFVPLALGTPMVAGFAANPLGIGPSDFSGPLTLAILHFTASQPGVTTIGVTWDSSDLNQGLVFLDLPVNPIAATTTVQAVAAVPEPSSLMLTASALVFYRRVRRRASRPATVPNSPYKKTAGPV